MDMVGRRFEIWLTALDPTVGREIAKTRPCIIVSPDVMNSRHGCVIIIPLTSTIRTLPFRFSTRFKGKAGQAALDQMRSVDKSRLIKKVGTLPEADASDLCDLLTDFFSYA